MKFPAPPHHSSLALKFGLNKKTILAILDVLGQYQEIERVIIYGSRAKGQYRHGSDIDLVLQAPRLNLTGLFKIENELDDLLLPYKIDLSLYHCIDNQELLRHIDLVGQNFEI